MSKMFGGYVKAPTALGKVWRKIVVFVKYSKVKSD